MPVLCDKDVYMAIVNRQLNIDPLIRNNVQPGSVDLTLHNKIEVMELPPRIDFSAISSPELKSFRKEIDITGTGYELKPGDFVTGYSEELLELPKNVVGKLFNRNSLVRVGLDAAISSFANPGFKGRKTIVIRNFGPATLILRPGMRICQITFFTMSSEALRGYEERHDEKLLEQFTPIDFPGLRESVENIDNALSDFLNDSIRRAAARN